VADRIRSIVKSNDFIKNHTCDLPACSIVPQPTMLLQQMRILCHKSGEREHDVGCHRTICKMGQTGHGC
jgi:hypothetical protein